MRKEHKAFNAKIRGAAAADTTARQQAAMKGADSFQNFAAKLGIGTDNLSSGGSYGFNPITRINQLLEWIYRGSWIAGVVVDSVANDMTRAGVTIKGKLDPADIAKIETANAVFNVWGGINDACKWSRLYGGAIGVILIDGQDMREPLRLERIAKGQFKGVYALDRWQVTASFNDLVPDFGPDLGMPMFYTVTGDTPVLRNKIIHFTRVIRLDPLKLPHNQRMAENMWGLSVLERLYDRLQAYDTATTGAAQLVHKAYLRTFKVKEMKELISAGGAALDGLVKYVDMVRRFQSIEGMTTIDADDEFGTETHNAFGGLADILKQFGEQLAGAAEIPLTRLFGQSSGAMNNGDNTMVQYYESIGQKQNTQLYLGVGRVYRAQAMSCGIKPPDDFDIVFNPLHKLTTEEAAEVAGKMVDLVTKAADGVIDRATALKELKQSSHATGIFTNISDEDIEEAEAEPPPGLDEDDDQDGDGVPDGAEPAAKPKPAKATK